MPSQTNLNKLRVWGLESKKACRSTCLPLQLPLTGSVNAVSGGQDSVEVDMVLEGMLSKN